MGFESWPQSIDTLREIQLPDDILELCKQLNIPDEKLSQLVKLDKPAREDIYAAILATKEIFDKILERKQRQYLSVISGNSSQA